MSGGATPLFFAGERGHQSAVRILLDHGASVDKGNSTHQTSSYVAQTKGHAEIAKLLVPKLREAQIEKIRTVMNDNCPICLEKLLQDGAGSLPTDEHREIERFISETAQVDRRLFVFPICHQIYHKACIDKWLRGNQCCPKCRQLVQPNLRFYLP